jgi:hypothetical protein
MENESIYRNTINIKNSIKKISKKYNLNPDTFNLIIEYIYDNKTIKNNIIEEHNINRTFDEIYFSNKFCRYTIEKYDFITEKDSKLYELYNLMKHLYKDKIHNIVKIDVYNYGFNIFFENSSLQVLILTDDDKNEIFEEYVKDNFIYFTPHFIANHLKNIYSDTFDEDIIDFIQKEEKFDILEKIIDFEYFISDYELSGENDTHNIILSYDNFLEFNQIYNSIYDVYCCENNSTNQNYFGFRLR